MPDPMLLVGVAMLAVGTYATRLIGLLAGRRRAKRLAVGAQGTARGGSAPASTGDAAAVPAPPLPGGAPASAPDLRGGAPASTPETDATPARLRRSDLVVVVLLAAVALTGAVFDGAEPAGWARIAGVAVGAVCAMLRWPLAIVIVAAAATTALLRLAGVG
ncbi:AzlD domain-containing protein [Agromyces archimandritae]|uniref:AzlD domain-containing protein n=1 Tax=Agromyces archimandritae TaxID=2781962 RepID=A0A975FQ11_9MICO|nr:AzlD domain-containing protein [Agromyces archimandritae]QTX05894.1 AzlD domain-containing protein [Agromyces archimandritae]